MGIKSRAVKLAATVVLGVGLAITGLAAPAITGLATPVASANNNWHWHDDHGRDGWCQQYFGVSWGWPPPGWQWGDSLPQGVVAFWADFGIVWTWGAPNGTHPVQLDNGWLVTVY